MASTTPRYDCDCMKLLYAWFPPYHTWHEGKNQMWSRWLLSWSKDFFVKSVFANNKEITVQALLHCLPISNWDRKTGSCQDVTDYVVEGGTCIEVDFGGTIELENCCWASDSVWLFAWTSEFLVARLPTVEKWFWREFATEAGLSVVLFL